MLDALDRLPTEQILEVVTELIEQSTQEGSSSAEVLIGDLGEAYEKKIQAYLASESDDILKLIVATESSAAGGSDAQEIEELTSRILRRTQGWDKAAQPVQRLMQSRGLLHEQSRELAMGLRGLAVELFNSHDYLDIAKRISEGLRQMFAEVPDIVERVEEDILALDEIDNQRRGAVAQSMKQEADFAAAITYETTFGILFKDKFRISPAGVEWKGMRRSLDEIASLSWGGVRGQYGVTFDIFIGSDRGALHLQFDDEVKFDAIVQRLWRAVGGRLLVELVLALKKGQVFQIGSIRLSDNGVGLKIARMFRADLDEFVPWRDVRKTKGNGAVLLTDAAGNAKGSFDVRVANNAAVVSTALDILWKKGGNQLSGILD
jgi:hypothetical protein